MKTLHYKLIAFIFLPFSLISQWEKTYGGTEFEFGYSAKQTTDGGYILTGSTHLPGRVDSDTWLIKTDSFGDTLWTRIYSDTLNGTGDVVIQTSDGGYAILVRRNILTETTTILFKTNSQGDTVWTKIIGVEGNYIATSLVQTNDGNLLISGTISDSSIQNREDIQMAKIDIDGNNLWSKTYDFSIYDHTQSANETQDGGIILSASASDFDKRLLLIRTDQNGDTLWHQDFDLDYGATGKVIETSDGGFIIAGRISDLQINGNTDLLLIKTNSSGEIQWMKTYGGSGHELATSIEETANNEFIVFGMTDSYGAGEIDYWLLKTDSYGDTIWTKTFGGALNEYSGECHQTNDEGIILMGYRESYNNGLYDLWLIKTDKNGELETRELDELETSVYPNPVQNMLKISVSASTEKINELLVTSLNGEILKQYNGFIDAIYVSDLATGVYFLTLNTQEKDYTKMFIKE